MQEDNSNRKCVFTSKIVTSIIVGALLIAGMVIALSMSTKEGPPKETSRFALSSTSKLCRTKQCLRQAARILENMDADVNPCTNFYNFTCGNFMRHAKIPKDQVRLLVALENKKIVEDELIKAYNAPPRQFNSLIRDMKKFYHQCTESETYKNDTYNHIKQILKRLKWPVFYKRWNDQYASKFDWLEWEARFSKMGLVPVFLSTSLQFDMRNFSLAYIGLDCTVPTLSKDILALKKSGSYAKVYKLVIRKFLKIIANRYKGNASEEIVNFFLEIENIKPTRFEMSDANFFHAFKNVSVGVLQKELKIDLEQFLRKILPPSVAITKHTILGTYSHQCLTNMTSLLKAADKRHIANYMMWRAVQNLLWILSDETRRLDYRLKRAKTGIQAAMPLYQMCLNFIDEQIPELSSAMYVKMFFNENKKAYLEKMVKLLLKELEKVVNAAAWMDKLTKATARQKVKKLSYVTDHVAEFTQDKFLYEAYGKLKMTSPKVITNVGNVKNAAYQHMMRQYNWTPARRNKATLLPLAHVINAFYHPGLNAIAISTGIAQGCIYSHDQEAYLNFGAIGMIIGHELSHVFDNIGRLYDASGNYVNWWSNESNFKFEKESRCFVKQYNKFTLGPNLKLNGTLTLGENMADTGGTLLAYRAYLKWMEKYGIRKLPGLEKYTLKQMFWISVGNTWCDKQRPEALEIFLKTDVHSVGNFRVLGPLSNSEEFSLDFKCPLNSEMNPRNKCKLW